MQDTAVSSLMKSGSFWFPEAVAKGVASVDTLFYFIVAISTVMFVGIVAVMLYFIVKYRRTEDHQEAYSQVSHNTPIEIIWTVIPLIICYVIFHWGYKDFIRWSAAPNDAQQIHVTAMKWMWKFEYPSGIKTVADLVVPVNQPVKLIMTSEDVIHSFYVPNFRMKRDMIPNRYTTLWFEAEKVGVYQLFCTEYCGDGHSMMLGSVKVLSQEDYDAWVKNGGSEGGDLPLDQVGAKLYTSRGCNACHTLDGSTGVGPTWKGLFGSKRAFVSGASKVADEDYLRESIVNPVANVVQGFQPVMPSYGDLLSDREVSALVEYIKTLK